MGNSNLSAVEKLADTANAATDKIASKAESTVDSARTLANEALNNADVKVRTLREDIKPAIDAISARVQDMAEHGRAACVETSAQAREKFNSAASKASAYVSEQPMKSMAIAAAAGAALAFLLGRRRR